MAVATPSSLPSTMAGRCLSSAIWSSSLQPVTSRTRVNMLNFTFPFDLYNKCIYIANKQKHTPKHYTRGDQKQSGVSLQISAVCHRNLPATAGHWNLQRWPTLSESRTPNSKLVGELCSPVVETIVNMGISRLLAFWSASLRSFSSCSAVSNMIRLAWSDLLSARNEASHSCSRLCQAVPTESLGAFAERKVAIASAKCRAEASQHLGSLRCALKLS